jgi:hypothetical protein
MEDNRSYYPEDVKVHTDRRRRVMELRRQEIAQEREEQQAARAKLRAEGMLGDEEMDAWDQVLGFWERTRNESWAQKQIAEHEAAMDKHEEEQRQKAHEQAVNKVKDWQSTSVPRKFL